MSQICLAYTFRCSSFTHAIPAMPPKKKVRQPSRAASTPAGDAVDQAEETSTPTKAKLNTDSVTADAWTDEQETSLFKSMIRWKPVGSSSKYILSPHLYGGRH